SVANQAIQNYIGDAETFIITVSTDAEIQPVMEEHGYDATELAAGTALLQTAATAFGVRLTGVAGKAGKQTDLDTASTKAREDYAAFREIARAAFPEQADRIGLGLTGNVPQDLQKFITLAHTSYTNAQQAPWTTKMTIRNYAKARLQALNTDLTALTQSDSASNIAAGAAEEDTTARDLAYNALKEWIKEAHGVARGAFRKNAGALTKLKL
ncbi:MAG: hypothetical protein ABI992_10560, partial [Chthoniobacterales bacterium]